MIKKGQIYQTAHGSIFKIKILSEHGDRLYIRTLGKDKSESYIAYEKFQEYIDDGDVILIKQNKDEVNIPLPRNRLKAVQ